MPAPPDTVRIRRLDDDANDAAVRVASVPPERGLLVPTITVDTERICFSRTTRPATPSGM